MRNQTGFSLIELLIVIGLMGALAALVLPSITADKEEVVDGSMVAKEMMDIRRAFLAFEADCLPNRNDRELIGIYGLEVLMQFSEEAGKDWSFPDAFDPARKKGWRGPYLHAEGRTSIQLSGGQGAGTAADVPVVYDPRYDTNSAEDATRSQRYYRVVRYFHQYENSGKTISLDRLALVFIGANGILDTVPASGMQATFDSSFANSGDDVVRALTLDD